MIAIHRYQDAKKFLAETREALEVNELENTFPLWAASQLAEQDTLGNSYCGAVWHSNDNNSDDDDEGTEENRTLVFAMVAIDEDVAFPSILLTDDVEKQGREAVKMLVQDMLASPIALKSIRGYESVVNLVKDTIQALKPSSVFTCNNKCWTYTSPHPEKLRASKAVTSIEGNGFSLRKVTPVELPLFAKWTLGFLTHYRHFVGDQFDDEDKLYSLCNTELRMQSAYFWCNPDGLPISMIWKRRIMRHGCSIAYVYTPPENRGCGYASTMVAAFTLELLKDFQYVTLLVDSAQDPHDNLYARLGYSVVGLQSTYMISSSN